jgi:hypothetical protein
MVVNLEGAMFSRNRRCIGAIAFVSLSLSGCGIYTPLLEPGEEVPENHVTGSLVNKIVQHVKCELGQAILYEIAYDKKNTAPGPRNFDWLDKSAGTVTLTMIVDERGSLAPGATWTEPLAPVENVAQTFGVGFGGSVSADATRKQQVDFTFDAQKDFIKNADFQTYNGPAHPKGTCGEAGGILIEGDLRIHEWLDSALFPHNIPGGVDPGRPDVLTDDITFVVTFTGSATPSWKLVRWSVNPNSPFASASRARTNEALIALGPSEEGKKNGKKTSGPSETVIQFRNIALIGSALNVSLIQSPLNFSLINR